MPPFHLEGPRTPVFEAVGGLRWGLPIWGCKEWVGDLYPEGTSAKRFLAAYAARLGCVEVNSTHYSIPGPAVVQSWLEAARPGFKFYPKFPQSVSHHQRLGELGDVTMETRHFVETARGLGENLGAAFLQLPPLFTLADFPLLQAFLRDRVPRDFPVTVELRHPSWFPRGGLAKPVYDFLAELGVGTVISETPGRRDVAHASIPGRHVLVRFLGTDGGMEDVSRVRAWIPYWREWVAKGREIGLILHLPDNARVLRFLAGVEAELSEAFGPQVPAPGLACREASPSQLSLDLV